MADGLLLLFQLLQHLACFWKHEYSATIRSKHKCADCIKQVPKNLYPFLFSHYHRLRFKKKHLENATSAKLGKDLSFNEMMLVFIYLMLWKEMCRQKKTSVIIILGEKNLKATKLNQ